MMTCIPPWYDSQGWRSIKHQGSATQIEIPLFNEFPYEWNTVMICPGQKLRKQCGLTADQVVCLSPLQPKLRLQNPECQHGICVGEDLIGLALYGTLRLDPGRSRLPLQPWLQLNTKHVHMPRLLAWSRLVSEHSKSSLQLSWCLNYELGTPLLAERYRIFGIFFFFQ